MLCKTTTDRHDRDTHMFASQDKEASRRVGDSTSGPP